MLKGNPIADDLEYRNRVFRILPGLKNLDVILTPRADRDFCRRYRKREEPDDPDSGAGAQNQEKGAESEPDGEEGADCKHEKAATETEESGLIGSLRKQTSLEEIKVIASPDEVTCLSIMI